MNTYTRNKIHLSILFHFLFFCGNISLIACDKEESISYDGVYMIPGRENLGDYEALYSLVDYQTVVQQCQGISLSGTSIAYFGGSLATLCESDVAKNVVAQNLGNPIIVSYGHGGYGFSSLKGSIQNYVDQAKPHDIFILWCSTNDYTGSVPLGEPTDYTEQDGFDESKRTTQCGGINYCIRKLKEINPRALIIGFTSLKFFGTDKQASEGYTETSPRRNLTGHSFIDYVNKQIECFQLNGIPYLDQWHFDIFTEENYAQYYKADGYHLQKNGYFLLGVKQFLCELLDNE